jgi:hypothetical protein
MPRNGDGELCTGTGQPQRMGTFPTKNAVEISGAHSDIIVDGRVRSSIPVDFDPHLYVLSYPDLFEAEVDPYEYFSVFGRHENRLWR